MINAKPYGKADATFIAMGSEQGIRELVDRFYDTMERDPDFSALWRMHTESRTLMRDKLALFLCMWSGGTREYLNKYGRISIPAVHKHLDVTEIERDQWLNCMFIALTEKKYPAELIDYLMTQLARPAESIRRYSNLNRS